MGLEVNSQTQSPFLTVLLRYTSWFLVASMLAALSGYRLPVLLEVALFGLVFFRFAWGWLLLVFFRSTNHSPSGHSNNVSFRLKEVKSSRLARNDILSCLQRVLAWLEMTFCHIILNFVISCSFGNRLLRIRYWKLDILFSIARLNASGVQTLVWAFGVPTLVWVFGVQHFPSERKSVKF